MADGVHAPMDAVQTARPSSMEDALPVETGRVKLRSGHHAVLASRDLTHYRVGLGAFVGHIQTKAPSTPALP